MHNLTNTMSQDLRGHGGLAEWIDSLHVRARVKLAIPSWQLVPIIKKAVKTLVQDQDLTLAFGTPFTVAMKDLVHSKDGEAMLDVMETLDYEIRHDPMWKHLLIKKQTDVPFAVATALRMGMDHQQFTAE